VRAEIDQIVNAGRQSPTYVITEEHLVHLPEPVRQYLRAVGIVGKRNIRTVHLRQKGLFRRKEGERWLSFTAEQYFTTDPPAFVWEARIRFLPLLSFSVIDMFANGHGKLQAKLLSRFKVADASGPETDQGELLRYLAECALFPTVFLSPYLEWESIDERTAKVTLRLSGLNVSALLHFDEESRLCRVTAHRYYIEKSGGFSLREWSGQFSQYQSIAGILIPARASVSWRLESGDFEYFRGETTEIELDI
jgi:hypothetical protein